MGLLLLPVGIFGVLEYYKQGHVDLRIVCILAIGFLAGSYFGSKIALSLPQETLKKIFAVLLIILAVKMIFFDKPHKDDKVNSSATITESSASPSFLNQKQQSDENENDVAET